MSEIEIPFNEWSKRKLSLGFKTATSRNKKYGNVGDTFKVENNEYKIKMIVKLPLWFIAECLHQSEGCDFPHQFAEVWEEIHPKKGWDDMQIVWYHFFSPTGNKLKEI